MKAKTVTKKKALKYEPTYQVLVGFDNLYELLDKLIEKKVAVVFYQGEILTIRLEI